MPKRATYCIKCSRDLLKGFVEAVRFTLTEYGPVGSHGDPIQARIYGISAVPKWHCLFFGTPHPQTQEKENSGLDR